MCDDAPVKHTIDIYISNNELSQLLYDLNGPIEGIISKFQLIKEKVLALGYLDVKIFTRNCDESFYFEIYGVRMQTDDEYQKELGYWTKNKIKNALKASKRNAKTKEREEKTLVKLLKKYGVPENYNPQGENNG